MAVLLGTYPILVRASDPAFIGWACGGMDEWGGVLLGTTNGTDWVRQGVGQLGTNDISGVTAVGGRHVWVVGDPEGGYASIYYSSDAGATWERQGDASSLPNASIHKVWAVDRNVVWAVGVEGAVIVTEDGGRHWSKVPVPGFSNMLQGVTAVDRDTAWISGERTPNTEDAMLFHTENGGVSWTPQNGNALTNTGHMLGLYALDENRVWAVGGSEVILSTTNAGTDWNLFFKGVEKDGNEICVLDENRIWSANDSVIKWTTNGGGAWESYNTAEYTMDVSTPDGTNVWAVSSGYWGGRIYYSPDAGVTWTNVAESSTWHTLFTIDVQRAPLHLTHYVDAASIGAVSPYTSWATAASNIQDAVNAAEDGDLVLVTNGIYLAGGGVAGGGYTLTNRVCINKTIDVCSIEGAAHTFIVGAGDPISDGNGEGAVRCAWLADGASLTGFTLTNGYTSATNEPEMYGGGIWCQSTNVRIEHCVITGNSAEQGGGVYRGLLDSCDITGNQASGKGGGVCDGVLFSSLVNGNTAGTLGGGAWNGSLFNCTVVENSADTGGGAAGSPVMANCIVYYNTAASADPNLSLNVGVTNIQHLCVTPAPQVGSGHITNAPLLAGMADPRLLSDSPCINAGVNQPWMNGAEDKAGNSRIIGDRVDIGACEYPLAVTGVTAVVSGRMVRVQWSAMVGAQGVRIYRSTTPGSNGVEVASLGAGVTSWTDSTVIKGKTYYYTVRANYGASQGESSAQALMRLLAAYLDFDGDTLADIAVYTPDTGMWYILQSSVNTGRFQAWGWNEAMPVPGDYDGDGLYDVAVYAPSYGMWHIWLSGSQTAFFSPFGLYATTPVPGDYDGDGIYDLAYLNPKSGLWMIRPSSTLVDCWMSWGFEESVPVPADYDGDGKCDVAVYIPENGLWCIWQSATRTARFQAWGWADAIPVPGDYDGDGLTDVAVYDPEGGAWLAWLSASQSMSSEAWGWSAAWPVPADYDGDGKYDRTVYAPVYGMWYLWQSGSNTSRMQPWGWNEAEPMR